MSALHTQHWCRSAVLDAHTGAASAELMLAAAGARAFLGDMREDGRAFLGGGGVRSWDVAIRLHPSSPPQATQP